MRATKRTETEKMIIEITLTVAVQNNTANLDGDIIDTGSSIYENYEVVITGKESGKTIRASGKPGGFAFFATEDKFSGKYPTGAYSRIGDAYVSKTTHDAAMEIIAALDAELGKQAGVKEVSAETTENEIVSMGYGYCKKCNSYCYGDCEA